MVGPLRDAVARFVATQPGPSPFRTAVDGLVVFRSEHEKAPDHVLFRPALCLVLQGAKCVMFGDRRYDYRAGQALVVNVEMPLSGRVIEANPGAPYLGLILELDPAILREVLAGLRSADAPSAGGDLEPGLFVADLTEPLVDCVLRLVRLLDTPDAIPTLLPLILREVAYWLLIGPNGRAVARITLTSAHTASILHAIHTVRDHFREPIRVDQLARSARMSCSTFHRQFKAITSMTPLQYQKNLRLLEARRLLMAAEANVEAAAWQVGYESASQFNREYARMFGAPPRRDIVRWRDQPTAAR